jgi:hypothetical protein
MSYLKLHRDEPETEAPAPIPFNSPDRSWRNAGKEMDSIAQVEQALADVDRNFSSLSEQVNELPEPIRMSDWMDDDDDGPYAA